MILWTDVITTELWPYAIKLAIDVGNNCPKNYGLTALERFSSTKGNDRVKNVILLDLLASSSIQKYFNKNQFQNGHLNQDKPFILVYCRSMQKVSLWFWISKLDIFLHNSTSSLMIILQQQTQGLKNKIPDNWGDIFKNHRELPPEELQFSIGKKWKTPTDRSEGDLKVNKKSPADLSEGDRKVKKNSPTDHS